MNQSSISTPYAQRLAEKFRESQEYLRANGLIDQLKLFMKISRLQLINNAYTSTLTSNTIWL